MNLLIALQFLTRIPIPAIQFNERHNFTKCVKYYPLIGLLIGIILAAFYFLLFDHLPSLVLSAGLTILSILISGGLHLDGFMDTVDGIMSGTNEERMLEIMKDSRVGAHSVWAVVSLLIVKFSLLASIPHSFMLTGLLLMPVVARWTVVFSMSFWPYGRQRGLGKMFLDGNHQLSYAINTLLIFALSYWLLGKEIILILVLVTGVITLFNTTVAKKLSGLTGDVYGAVIEITEVVFLFLYLLLIC